jgi:hypothetical protein
MLGRLAKGSGLAAVGLALMVGQGCKKKQEPAPVQPVVRTVPRARTPDFPDGPPPEPLVVDKPVHHSGHRLAAPVVRTPKPAIDPEAEAAAQRQRDAALLQQQQAASQKQQQELNGVVQRSYKIQQEQQAEPRIQEAPEVPINQPLPGLPNQRIQDNPTAPAPQSEPEQPEQPDENSAPDQTNPSPPPQG